MLLLPAITSSSPQDHGPSLLLVGWLAGRPSLILLLCSCCRPTAHSCRHPPQERPVRDQGAARASLSAHGGGTKPARGLTLALLTLLQVGTRQPAKARAERKAKEATTVAASYTKWLALGLVVLLSGGCQSAAVPSPSSRFPRTCWLLVLSSPGADPLSPAGRPPPVFLQIAHLFFGKKA